MHQPMSGIGSLSLALLLSVSMVQAVASAPAAAADGAAVAPAAADPAPRARPGCPAPPPLPAYYVSSQVDLIALIAPPPAPGSPEQQADLAAVLAAQRAARGNGTVERAVADSEQTCARFKDVLGPALKSAAAAHALQFINDAAMSAALASAPPKRYWKRPRPYVLSKEVQRLADVAVGGEVAHGEYPEKYCVEPPPKNDEEARKRQAKKEKDDRERANTSYPSGHAAYGMACAVLLSAALPEKRVELFARGRQYGESRVIVGAHYPSDVAAGQQAALLGTTLVMQNASFERQFAGAQTELRAALGLPAALPDLEPNKDLFKDKDKDGEAGAEGAPPPMDRDAPVRGPPP
jgi:acid phosphatase (class A)